MKVVISVDTAHDDATHYLRVWSEKAANTTSSLVRTIRLVGNEALRSNFEDAVKSTHPSGVFFHAHGSPDCVIGNNTEPLVTAKDNEHMLSGSVVHALSCSSAKELGPRAIAAGARAYIGYVEEYVMWHLRGKTTDAEKSSDSLASLFLDPAFKVEHELINGSTVQKAYNSSQTEHLDSLQQMIAGNVPSEYASALYSNFKHQVLLGDSAATL